MKIILKSRKRDYIAKVGIFLIMVALIGVMVGCGGTTTPTPTRYNLTMAVAPAGNGTATDLTNASPYTAGTVVSIKAVAAAGYRFVSWTAPAGTFGNATSATTTFTMPAQAVTVTANFVPVYALTMAVNPVGGGTATDLTNTSPYAAGTVVNIKVVAAAPYQFVSWSAPAGTFGNANAAQTTFTMPAQNVTVTAHFVGPLDHFTCYLVDEATPPYIGENVTLEDQLGAVHATVGSAMAFGNPAEKLHGENVTPISNPDHHFTVYDIVCEEEPQMWEVEVKNQFGIQWLTVWGPVALAVPTQKMEPGGHQAPVGLDHYLLYLVTDGSPVEEIVNLNDEFGNETQVEVYEPVFFANPVKKTHYGVTEIRNPEAHAVIYSIYGGGYFEREVVGFTQFGFQVLDVSGPDFLAVPSEKIDYLRLYSLTMAANPVEGGTATDLTNASPYAAGTAVNIQAVAAAGYEFVSWTAPAGTFGDANAAETTFTMPAQAVTVTANFVAVYDLTMAVAPGGSGTATDLTNTSPYAAGTIVSIQAVAAAGYRFVNWTAPAGTFGNTTAATTSFTMPAQAVTVTANFVAVYDLTMAVNFYFGGTATDLTNASPYTAGTIVSIKAVAATGYPFVNWTAPAGTFGNATSATTTFTMPAQDVTVTANFAPFAGGSGTEGDPYQIANWYQLNSVHSFMDSYFILLNNLNSTTAGYTELASPTANGGKGWSPIGSREDWGSGLSFSGTFDGQGYEIRDLFIDRPGDIWNVMGVFGCVKSPGVIRNVKVLDAEVTSGDWMVGALVGQNSGSISNCYASGNMTGGQYVGGLVGSNHGSISDCYATGSVTGGDYVGGLLGYNQGSISGCYASSSVTGANYVGGLVGDLRWTTASNCYATGSVSGHSYVGGLVGVDDNAGASNCYSTGNVTGDLYIGGLMASNSGTVSNCFWDTATSGQGTSDGGTGKTTAEMMGIDTFSGVWDIIAVANINTRNTGYIWNIVDDVTYPFLSWQGVAGAEYSLTMVTNPEIGGTATDVTDDAPYTAGTVVNIRAVAAPGYGFRNWTAPAGTFGNATAAQTTFTMPAQNVTVTANFATFAGGSGTEGDPYQVADWYQLHNVRNYLDKHFILVNNLSSSTAGYTERASPTANGGYGWQPIGTSDYRFSGTFDGQGHEIRDLFIDRPDEDRVGLFCAVLMGGVIENVEVVNADVTGNDGVGILVGATAGTVSSSCSSGSVSGSYYVGGLVGYNNPGGYVSNSNSASSVDGYEDVGGLVGHNSGDVGNSHGDGGVFCDYEAGGGLVGYNDHGSVDGSHSIGSVTGYIHAGGLVGCNDYGDVSNSYADGNVTSSAYNVGGLVGYNYYGTVDNSHATGSVTGSSSSVGGLVGYNYYGTVSNSHAEGNVIDGGLYVGGLVGMSFYGTVNECYAAGSVHGSDDWVGGLVGENEGDASHGYVSNSYATGNVTADTWGVGGLVGYNTGHVSNCYAHGNADGHNGVGGLVGATEVGGTVDRCYSTGSVTGDINVGGLQGWNGGTVSNSFWDNETSGQGTSHGGTGKTTAQMQDITTFSGAGWNITNVQCPCGNRDPSYIWNIGYYYCPSYPFLSWEATTCAPYCCF